LRVRIAPKYLPPKTGINSSPTTQDATSHLVGIGAGNTGRIDPDLVAQPGNIEASEVGAVEPLGLHGSLPSAG
jgi:hypothetical protein